MSATTIRDHLLAFEGARPIVIDIDGKPFVPLFRTEAELHGCMKWLQRRHGYSIKRITDPTDFLRSLDESGVQACLNLRPSEAGAGVNFQKVTLREKLETGK